MYLALSNLTGLFVSVSYSFESFNAFEKLRLASTTQWPKHTHQEQNCRNTMSNSVKIAAFEATSLADIDARISTCQASFRSQKTKDLEWRLVQLRKLYWGLVDNTPLFEEALKLDMNKCKYETHLTELEWCKMECLDLINNLEKWVKDEPVVNVPMQFWPMKLRIRNEPLGTILVIGAYNYPIMLNLVPVAGAIAAGNSVVLKPSEHAPHAAMVLKKLFDEVLDPEAVTLINGAVPETKQVLNAKFDKIVFTGGKKTGTIIAQKAAETLTPVLLELGGRNPAFVSKNANIKLAARRIMWQKCLNAGQVCLSHNYVLIERAVLSEFIGEINKQYKVMMPKGAQQSPDYSRIVNKGHFDRIKKMLDDTQGKIVMGGTVDESDLYIEPTAVLVEDHNDSMVVDESFGPIWSIIPIDSLDEGIRIANEVDPTPLALFTFGTDAENDKGKFYFQSSQLLHPLPPLSITKC